MTLKFLGTFSTNSLLWTQAKAKVWKTINVSRVLWIKTFLKVGIEKVLNSVIKCLYERKFWQGFVFVKFHHFETYQIYSVYFNRLIFAKRVYYFSFLSFLTLFGYQPRGDCSYMYPLIFCRRSIEVLLVINLNIKNITWITTFHIL